MSYFGQINQPHRGSSRGFLSKKIKLDHKFQFQGQNKDPCSKKKVVYRNAEVLHSIWIERFLLAKREQKATVHLLLINCLRHIFLLLPSFSLWYCTGTYLQYLYFKYHQILLVPCQFFLLSCIEWLNQNRCHNTSFLLVVSKVNQFKTTEFEITSQH